MENNLRDVMMIDSLLDTESEQFTMLKENFDYVMEGIEYYYEDFFGDRTEYCDTEEIIGGIINIPIIDVLKNPPTILKDMWDIELGDIRLNFEGEHEEIGLWFSEYFKGYWENLEGEKLEQYNEIYQKQLDYYLNERWGNGLTNMDYLNKMEQKRQQYLKQII